MANPTLTIIGNLVRDPESRWTQAGHPVVSFTVATSDRRKNEQTNEWADENPSFWNCTAWRGTAEAIADQFTKGTPVIVHGRIRQRTFETKEGEKRHAVEVDVSEAGIDVGRQASRARNTGQNFTRPSTQGGDPWPQQDQAPF